MASWWRTLAITALFGMPGIDETKRDRTCLEVLPVVVADSPGTLSFESWVSFAWIIFDKRDLYIEGILIR